MATGCVCTSRPGSWEQGDGRVPHPPWAPAWAGSTWAGLQRLSEEQRPGQKQTEGSQKESKPSCPQRLLLLIGLPRPRFGTQAHTGANCRQAPGSPGEQEPRTGSPQGPSPWPGTDHKPASHCSSALLAPSPLSRARRGARESENLNPNRLSCRWLNKCPNDFPVFLCSSDSHSKTTEKCLCEWKPVALAKNTVLLLLEQPRGRHATSGQGSGGLCGRWLSTAAGWKACLLSAAWCRD